MCRQRDRDPEYYIMYHNNSSPFLNNFKFQYLIKFTEDFFFILIGTDSKIRISGQHCGKLRLAVIIKNVNWFPELLCAGKFIADPQGRAGALGDYQITLSHPVHIPVVDEGIPAAAVFLKAQVPIPHVLRQHFIRLVNMIDDLFIKSGIRPAAANRPGKIYFSIQISPLSSFSS